MILQYSLCRDVGVKFSLTTHPESIMNCFPISNFSFKKPFSYPVTFARRSSNIPMSTRLPSVIWPRSPWTCSSDRTRLTTLRSSSMSPRWWPGISTKSSTSTFTLSRKRRDRTKGTDQSASECKVGYMQQLNHLPSFKQYSYLYFLS